jgi:hypothetical protein
MRYEKNFVINVLKTILGKKNNKKVREDLQVVVVYEPLWLKLHLTKANETVMPVVL